MGDRGTGWAITLLFLQAVLVFTLVGIAWLRPGLQRHEFGIVVAIILAVEGLIMLSMFFTMDNRRPIVFAMIHFDLILLPGIAFMIAQAFFGLKMDIDGPDAPSPWYLVPYALFIAIIFFRLSTWALTFTPEPDQIPASPITLRQNLLSLNSAPDIPFMVKPGNRPDELIMDWKYADATWLGLMRVHRLSYLTRFVIRLSESDHTARVREFQSQFDASGGSSGGNLSFKAQWGITFYEYRRETVFGLQIENGHPVPKISYTYQFNIDEMRDPLQKIVVQNGWTFKAVLLFAPWLTG